MKTKSALLAAIAGICVGTFAASSSYGQAPSAGIRSAYFIGEFELTDPEGIKPYREQVESTIKPFGGRFIVRGGDIAPLEGEAPHGRIIVIAFDSMAKAQAWYDSPSYEKIKPIRHRSGKSRVFIVEGIPN